MSRENRSDFDENELFFKETDREFLLKDQSIGVG